MTRLQHFRLPALIALLALGSLRCTDKVDPDPVPSAIELLDGDNQSGPVGQALANPLVVLVTDDAGNPVEGVSVSWTAQGGGSVSGSASTTGSNGRASTQRTLGPQPGAQTTQASVAGLEGSPLTFTSTATDQPPAGGLAITTNPPVSALTGEVFAPEVQPVVVLRDDSGNPVADAPVTATIVSGGGTLDGTATATTDASGIAAFGDLGITGTGEQTIEFTSGTASVTASPVALSPLPAAATTGSWGPVVPWDIVPLHMSLLPDGKIFAWGKTDVADTMGMPRVWDPAQGGPSTAPMVNVNEMLFCAGHTLLPDGGLMIAGGHHMDDAGIKVTYVYQNGAMTRKPDMAYGRWYPTLTVLPDGKVLSMAGRNEAGTVVRTPELWNGSAWSQLTGAGTLEIPYYPRNFVDPKNGLIFYAGERIMSRWFNAAGTGSWTATGPSHIWPYNRDYGTAVMYETGKILYAGGGGHTGWPTPDPRNPANLPTATAEQIDLNQTSPQWQSAGAMSAPRRHLNSTILPDGQVLITGGTRGGGFVNIDQGLATKEAEIWNPTTGQWTTLAANQVMRVYHAVSMLLPDGTVLHGASGDAMAIQPGGGIVPVPPERNHEIFSPPYLFKGARPTITSVAPANVGYAGTITVTTPNAAQVTEARWIRLGSVTHAFDMGQRANTLSFTRTASGVDVTVPGNANVAPPGYYMLFILNRNGVPSAGTVVRVQ